MVGFWATVREAESVATLRNSNHLTSSVSLGSCDISRAALHTTGGGAGRSMTVVVVIVVGVVMIVVIVVVVAC